MQRILKLIFPLLFLSMSLPAQIQDPVKWLFGLNGESELTFEATIDAGWHLYDINLPKGGPNSTVFAFEELKGVELIGKVTATTKPVVKYDKQFEMDLRWYERSVVFKQKFKVTDPARFKIAGSVEFQVCNDRSCLPPTTEEFEFTSKNLPEKLMTVLPATTGTAVKEGSPEIEEAKIADPAVPDDAAVVETVNESQAIPGNASDLWEPAIELLKAYGEQGSNKDNWWMILIAGFGGGLIALLTPCVWPMIPMTVSFFLKRSKKNRAKAITDAFTYGASIVVIYLILGLLITVIFGASALNELSTSAIFNLLFFALLVVFAISFFGAFELTLPASWTTKLDRKADSTSGLLSIFFMAFTLTLVSFSCTGPIIGTLLVEAASQGSLMGPAIGMFGFALALSIPFALFAVFPSWLESMPKSGGWLNSVKVVLGFLELALALKFLSVADLAYGWGILDREVFLVLWIVLFALLGVYLLGKIKFSHDSDLNTVPVPRLFMAILSFAFAVYMIPGLWGAPLKAISAFSPPLYTQDFSLYDGEVRPKYHDYEEGMEYAKKQGKPVMIDFTGHGCVNCREMETAVWSDARVKNTIDNDYVLISLYVDNKEKLPEVITVNEYGKTRKLKTVGDKWSYLQRSKFGANAQPFYVLLNNEGKPISPSYAYDKSVDKYLQFLKKGVEEYRKRELEGVRGS
ncbi:MAG: thioredoxin family protein [Dysgonamonadaceae bacterium]|jgi:thiol:disulfide interchange protein DsbD|nr:thioredoxin family protein [Dysgonamonadaceae bacterium]